MLGSNLISRLEFLVDKHAKWTVCLALVVSLFFVSMLPQLRFENSPGKLDIPLDDPVRVRLENFKSQFGGGELLIMGVEYSGPMEVADITRLERVTDSIKRLPGVCTIHSITNLPVLKWVPLMGVFALRPTFPFRNADMKDDSSIAMTVEELSKRSLFRNNLISENGSSTAIVMTLNPWTVDGEKGLVPLRELVDRIKSIGDKTLGKNAKLHFAGPAILNIALHNAMKRDLILFGPISLIAFVLVLILVLGSWRSVLLALGTAATALVWSLGMLPLTNTPLSIGLSMMIPVIPALSLMYAVHHLCYLFQSKKSSDDRQIGLVCFRRLVIPGLLCGLTTSIGFLSLSVSSLPGIREVGLFIGCGVLISALLANIVLPAVMKIIGWQGDDIKQRVGQRVITGVIERLQQFVLPKPGRFVIVTALLVTIMGYGILNLKVETNHLAYLENDQEVTEAFIFADVQFGGVLPLEILVDLSPNPTADEILLILELESDLRQLEGLGTVVSVADFVKEANDARPKKTVPLKPQLYLERGFISPGIWKLIARQATGSSFLIKTDSVMTVRISCRVHPTNSDGLQRLLPVVKTTVARHLSDYRTSVTGLSVYFARVEQYVMKTQTESFAIALAATIALLGFLSGSLRNALAVIIVNVLPVILVLGFMGWSGVPLDITTVMIASIALGIVVDDTIHLIYRFRVECESNKSIRKSLNLAFHETGLPVVTSTIILSVGFGSLMAANFVPTSDFGGLSTLTVLVAAVADLLLLPSLILLLMKIRKPNSKNQ